MIEIVNLADNPRYFKPFFAEIYAEFQSFFAGIPKEHLRKDYWSRRTQIYIALNNKNFIGCYSIKRGLIGDVYVNKKYRGKGIGRLLIKDAKKRNWYCIKWELMTGASNLVFYENQGFRVVSQSGEIYDMACYNRSVFILLASLVITGLICVLFF